MKLLATQMQVQQIVVTEFHQRAEPLGLGCRQCAAISVQESFQKEVILQHATSATPGEAAQTTRI